MFRLVLITLVAVPLIELWLLFTVGSRIGFWWTFSLVIFTGVLGLWLARREGLYTMQLIRLQLARGEIPGAALIDGACIFIGGIALLMPGFISDTLGFLLLMPYTRNIFKVGLKWLLANWIRSRGFVIIRKWD